MVTLNHFQPLSRFSRSPANSRRSPSLNRRRIQKSASSGRNGGKPPRTVHIDVYCTGSDGESVSSSMEDSSSSSGPSLREYHDSVQNEMEIASNPSTNPTVYESFGMKLKHKRAAREDLPRKFFIDTGLRRTPSNSNVPKRGDLRNNGECYIVN